MVKESFRKIDAHSHFGKTYFGPDSRPEDYLEGTKNLNIVSSIISPAPTPEIITNEIIFRPCVWKVNRIDSVTYVEQEENINSQEIIERSARRNPYANSNLELISLARKINCNQQDSRVLVMPIFHPILDDLNQVFELLKQPEVVAIKFHGVAASAGPESIPKSLIKELKNRNTPIIAHTDMYLGTIDNAFDYARELNHPQKWVKWAVETGVSTVITHGARLDGEAIHQAKNNPNILIGCAPDLAILGEKDHSLTIKTNNFLESLFELVNPNQLVFDIDYGWNTQNIGQWSNLDWDMCRRIETEADKAGFSAIDLEDIYYNNAARLFKL